MPTQESKRIFLGKVKIMKIEYSKSADALYVYFKESYISKSKEIEERASPNLPKGEA